ncbi:Os03g0687100, partial [Oryza sativa Japonica Group]
GCPLEPVPLGADHEVDDVEDADAGDHPVEEVEPPLVEVLRQPVAPGAGGPVHDGDEEPTEVVPQRQVAEGERAGHAPHVLRDLLVVELDLADEVERLREPQHHELRHHPQAGHGRDGAPGDGRPQRRLRQRDVPPPVLHHGRHHHRHRRQRDPDPLPLQEGEALVLARDPAEARHEEAVVDGDPQRLRQHGEHRERRRGDLEAPAEVSVGLQRGQHHVGRLLHDGDVVDDPRGPDGHDADEALHLLHLLHAAQPPRVRRRGAPGAHVVGAGHDGRLVEAPELVRVRQLGDDGAGVRRVEQVLLGVLGLLERPLPRRGGEHLDDAGEGGALGGDADVEPGAHEEEDAGEEHERGGDAEADGPADVALDVDDDGGGDEHGGGEGEVVPVEEAVDAALAGLRVGVELVGAERHAARPDPRRPQHQERERHEQHRELPRRRLRARLPHPALRRVQPVRGGRHRGEVGLR